MARIFVSGSSTGLGLMAGDLLAAQGLAPNPQAKNIGLQDRFIALCEEISGVALPA